jgi:hypothetical protein
MTATVTADQPVGFGVIGVGLIGAFHATNLATRARGVPCRLIATPLYALASRS